MPVLLKMVELTKMKSTHYYSMQYVSIPVGAHSILCILKQHTCIVTSHIVPIVPAPLSASVWKPPALLPACVATVSPLHPHDEHVPRGTGPETEDPGTDGLPGLPVWHHTASGPHGQTGSWSTCNSRKNAYKIGMQCDSNFNWHTCCYWGKYGSHRTQS